MQSPVIEREETQAPQCRHHWVIETPHGATSLGKCKHCQEVREFRNSTSDTLWEGDPMASIGKMAGGNRPIVREVRPIVSDD